MLYVERDKEGKIIALHNKPKHNATEQKKSIDQDILDFLEQNATNESWQTLLAISDMGFIRLLEDMVDLLIRKNVIIFTELPEKAQEKIMERKKIREKHASHSILTVDDII
ncbi:MAG: hypothetical protein WCX84_02720 [Syntrophales bacterium]|jgi:hypothetical protein|nr:hypothetical protein [Syntrophales bacterium]NLN59850.1 hypothetical protein [Deltaproteobacteria bacterium]